jgi:hypothetical protein
MSTLTQRRGNAFDAVSAERDRLRAINADLLAALKEIMESGTLRNNGLTAAQFKQVWAKQLAAIAAAEGKA